MQGYQSKIIYAIILLTIWLLVSPNSHNKKNTPFGVLASSYLLEYTT